MTCLLLISCVCFIIVYQWCSLWTNTVFWICLRIPQSLQLASLALSRNRYLLGLLVCNLLWFSWVHCMLLSESVVFPTGRAPWTLFYFALALRGMCLVFPFCNTVACEGDQRGVGLQFNLWPNLIFSPTGPKIRLAHPRNNKLIWPSLTTKIHTTKIHCGERLLAEGDQRPPNFAHTELFTSIMGLQYTC